jgi:hypothetical protein
MEDHDDDNAENVVWAPVSFIFYLSFSNTK